SYTKLRLDEHSMEIVVNHISGLDSSLARALCWSAAWDMVRDGELAARDYVALVCNGLPAERDMSLVTSSQSQAQGAVTYYAAPATARTATPRAKDAAWRRLTGPDPQPNWSQRALLVGFHHPAQLALTAPYVARFFEVIDQIWATRDSEQAQEFVELAYPAQH